MTSTLPHKILIAVTDFYDVFYPDGQKTGLFYSEGLHPYDYFTSKGWTVDIVSEDGTYGLDEHSITDKFLTPEELEYFKNPESPFNKVLQGIKKPEEIDYKEYGILFAAGGHGTIFDFPNADKLHKITEDIYFNGGVIAAVCHGPLLFPGLKDRNGETLIKGKKVTGFTDEGEAALGLDVVIKALNKPLVKGAGIEVGADYQEPPSAWGSYAVTDGRIVTGVNPASATETAEQAYAAFVKAV